MQLSAIELHMAQQPSVALNNGIKLYRLPWIKDLNLRNASLKKFGETGNWQDSAKTQVGKEYVETQILGKLTLDDVSEIFEDSAAERSRLRQQLDNARYVDIEVRVR